MYELEIKKPDEKIREDVERVPQKSGRCGSHSEDDRIEKRNRQIIDRNSRELPRHVSSTMSKESRKVKRESPEAPKRTERRKLSESASGSEDSDENSEKMPPKKNCQNAINPRHLLKNRSKAKLNVEKAQNLPFLKRKKLIEDLQAMNLHLKATLKVRKYRKRNWMEDQRLR